MRTRAELEELLEMQRMRLLASSSSGRLGLEENGIFQHVLHSTLGSIGFRGQGYLLCILLQALRSKSCVLVIWKGACDELGFGPSKESVGLVVALRQIQGQLRVFDTQIDSTEGRLKKAEEEKEDKLV